MGEVIQMFGGEDDSPFGVQEIGVPGVREQAPAPEAGAPAKHGPPRSVLKAQLERADHYARQAAARLTQLLPPDADPEGLRSLLDAYATIQENAALLRRRIAEPDVDVVKDLREFEQQVQAYVEAAELQLRQHVPTHVLQGLGQANGQSTTPWALWGAAAVGVGVLVVGFWPRKRRRALPAR